MKSNLNLRIITFLSFLAIGGGSEHVLSVTGCEEVFIDSNESNVPFVNGSSASTKLCYRTKETVFFASEYWPEQYAPRWVAYTVDGDRYGDDGCSTYTRAYGNCYINEDAWEPPFECNRSSDPFHADHFLAGEGISTRAFVNSGHDIGHIAPRQKFAWHVCGAYQTFSMANMSPQSAAFNQQIWADLESQVLSWGVEHGPIYVVSGTIFSRFPHEHFAVYKDGTLDSEDIYVPGTTLAVAAQTLFDNAENHPSSHRLRPLRKPNPQRLSNDASRLIVPTGYFKVVYRPAIDGSEEQAIGFLLPHSYDRLMMLADAYDGLDRRGAFWAFSSTIHLIEEASGVTFKGIPDNLKTTWLAPWFFERRGNREIRSRTCEVGNPAGVLLGLPRSERREACYPVELRQDEAAGVLNDTRT